jgi:hypothetical protein
MELFDDIVVATPQNQVQTNQDDAKRTPSQIQADIKAERSKPGEFYMTKPYHGPDPSRQFSVTNPLKNGDNIEYTVAGKSPFTNEKISVKRRYQEFYSLRVAFIDRLPGLYVPPLPEKKLLNSTKEDFIAERCYLLDKFMKQLTRCPYLYESEEFRVFLHPDQDIDKQLQFMMAVKNTPGVILKRFRTFFDIRGCFSERQQ